MLSILATGGHRQQPENSSKYEIIKVCCFFFFSICHLPIVCSQRVAYSVQSVTRAQTNFEIGKFDKNLNNWI